MREIKFRAYDKKHKIMFEVMDINFVGKRVECFKDKKKEGCIHAKFKLRDVIIMQFTGLKDKNGKEIFEGDILNWDSECTILIKWSEEQAGFYYKVLTQKDNNICAFDIRFYRSEESAEIIGNIYENPELLEGKK